MATVMLRPSLDAAAAGERCCTQAIFTCSRWLSSSLTLRRASSSSGLHSSFLCSITSLQATLGAGGMMRRVQRHVSCSMIGEDPEWSDIDYIALGLAHCFQQEEGGKVKDVFLIEPVSASSLECLENGGATSYKHVTASNLGTAFKHDVSLLPPQFASGQFCENFDFRAKCASRTWKRPHAVQNLVHIVPSGSVLSEYNFSLADKRIINKERIVTDADNIKQDMSIDVYGRNAEEAKDEASAQIASLYNA